MRATLGIVASSLLAAGCGDADHHTVVTADGVVDTTDLYDAVAQEALGSRDLLQLDTNRRVAGVRLALQENGRLGLALLPVESNIGDAPFQIEGNHASCTLRDRWRLLDERRIALLMACDDGFAREAVFVAGRNVGAPGSAQRGSIWLLDLETMGDDQPAEPQWRTYKFALRTP